MLGERWAPDPPAPDRVAVDDDFQLALYLCYELSYRGLAGVADDAERDPVLLTLRRTMEGLFEAELVAMVPQGAIAPDDVAGELRRMDADSTLNLARYMAGEADLEQVRELAIHRSAYHLKEADPHTFVIPRLGGATKAALVEIQSDEYGGGAVDRVHSELFAKMLRGLGLDDTYGAYLHRLPGVTLATVNLMSLFGMHRRWRGAAVGHLALFELGSSRPNRLYGDGLRRLGFGPDVTDFHDEHVEADAVHSMVATYDLAARLACEEPGLAGDVVFGARALAALETAAGDHLLEAWQSGRTSLLRER